MEASPGAMQCLCFPSCTTGVRRARYRFSCNLCMRIVFRMLLEARPRVKGVVRATTLTPNACVITNNAHRIMSPIINFHVIRFIWCKVLHVLTNPLGKCSACVLYALRLAFTSSRVSSKSFMRHENMPNLLGGTLFQQYASQRWQLCKHNHWVGTFPPCRCELLFRARKF